MENDCLLGCRRIFNRKSSAFDKFSKFISEFLGTLLLIFLGCMGCANPNLVFQHHFNFGIVLTIVIQVYGNISGSHLNPAITLASYFFNVVSAPMIPVYFAGQFGGALVGYGLLKWLVPESVFEIAAGSHGFCMTIPLAELGDFKACVIEFIITLVLISICCSTWDPRNHGTLDSIAIKFGLALMSLSLTASPYSGASMNPARSLAPAIWNNDYSYQWIYWVGPFLGGLGAAFLYKFFFRPALNTHEQPIMPK